MVEVEQEQEKDPKYKQFAIDLRKRAEEIAADKYEKFGSEHIALAMDEAVPGAAYNDGNPDHPDLITGVAPAADPLLVKLEKLEDRALVYLRYDRYLAENGFTGNREIDAAIKRRAIWNAHKDELDDGVESTEESRIRFLSFMCKTNGMFLGREVLNRDFTFYTHGPVFDFFVQKNPYVSIPQQDKENKIRLLQMPRGSYKSVSDGIDCVQYIIVHADIRIMFLTASLGLEKDFVKEVKNYFIVDTEASEPTPFQFIFANDARLERAKRDGKYQCLNFLIPEGHEGKETEFICPARSKGDQKKKEVTIWAGSVGAGKVGKHCNVIKADDAIDEKNSETPALIAKTKKRLGMAAKLVDPGGYRDNLGTPYAPNDHYNHIRMNVRDVLLLIRPAKWLKRDVNGATAIDRGTPEKELTDNDWSLLFPVDKYGDEKLSYNQLRINQEEDPIGFPSQYMLDPHGYKKVSFPEALIYQQTITRDQMPSQIEPFACYVLCDLADTQNSTSDFSVFAIMMVDRENRGYIVEIYRDRYTFHEICLLIAKINHEYKPIQIIIENARGAEKLKGDMVRASQDFGDKQIPLNFIPVKNSKGAKGVRIGKLEGKLRDRVLYFLNSVSCYQDLVAEFRDFGSAPHDDIPDAIGFCEHVLPDLRGAPADPNAAAAALRVMNDKAFFEMIHGSPEDFIRHDVPEPMPETVIQESPDDFWDPFSPVPFGGR